MTVDARQYTTRRQNIVNALVDLIERIDGTGEQQTAIAECSPRLTFWDEVKEFPAVHLNAGRELRTYDGGGFKFRYLTITLRCYVEDNDDAVGALDGAPLALATPSSTKTKPDQTNQMDTGGGRRAGGLVPVSVPPPS